MDKELPDTFLDLLSSVIDRLRDRLFYVDFKKQAATKNRYKRIEFLVDSLCLYEQSFPNKCTILEQPDSEYLFLKLVLEKNVPLFVHEEKIFGHLGIKRDRSRLSESEKNSIAVQSAAQSMFFADFVIFCSRVTYPKSEFSSFT